MRRYTSGGQMMGLLLLVGLGGAPLGAQENPPGQENPPSQSEPATPIPPITDADRDAAFPEVEPHRLRGDAVYAFLLFDRLEWQGAGTTHGIDWNGSGWVGGVRNRLWFRTEGHSDDGALEDAEAHLLYGRAIARWWDVVVGVRQDFRPGPAQTWAAFGLQGLAPYWFDIEVTGYVSDAGQTAARLEVDYELLFTNRLILRPRVELNLYGKRNAARGIGAGLADTDVGLRLRYEWRRELAPYIGVSWLNTHAETSDLARTAGEPTSDTRLVAGVRLWY